MKKFIKSVIFVIAMLCAVSVQANNQPERGITTDTPSSVGTSVQSNDV